MPKVDTLVDAHIDLIYTPNIQYVPHHTKTPYICTIHDLSFVHMPAWFTKKQRLWHYLQRVKYQAVRSTAIIVPSESTKSDVVHTFDIPESKVHVVYPGIDQSAYAVISDEDTQLVQQTYHLDRPYILYLGTIEPRKNITMLIESYVHGMYNKKGIELIVAGAPGWNNKDILRAIDTTPGVRYIGYVPAAHKAALYRGAAVFVYPSLFEGFGFPVLEAMAQGTPVITSNRTSLPEITYGQVQYIYPYRIDECISAIDEALSHPRLSDARNISQKYTWEHTAHQLGVIFEQYK
jgi:glycosyltransferase involved in cell wall biosynthesis